MDQNKSMFYVMALQFYLNICHQEGPRKSGRIGNERNMSLPAPCWQC